MSVLSRTPVRFPVPWDPETAFWLKPGTVIERAEFEAEIAGEHRAAQVYPFQLSAELANGIAALLPDDPEAVQRVHTLAMMEAQADEDNPMSAPDIAALAEMRDLVEQHWPSYRALVKQTARREQLLPIVALQFFCTGWDNLTGMDGEAVTFVRGPDQRVSLEALGQIDPLTLRAAGLQAYRLQYGQSAEKNSAPRSNVEDAPATSLSGATTAKAGRSRAKSGVKTR